MKHATREDVQNLRSYIKSNDTRSAGLRATQEEINKQKHAQGKEGIGEGSMDVGGGAPSKGGGRGAMSGKIGVVTAPAGTPEAERQKEEIKDEGKQPRFLQGRDENGQFTNVSTDNMARVSKDRSKGISMQKFLKGVDLDFIIKDEGNATFKYLDDEGNAKRIMMTFKMDQLRFKESLSTILRKGSFLDYVGYEGGFVERATQGRRSKEEQEAGLGYTGQQKSITSQKTLDELAKSSKLREKQYGATDAAPGKKVEVGEKEPAEVKETVPPTKPKETKEDIDRRIGQKQVQEQMESGVNYNTRTGEGMNDKAPMNEDEIDAVAQSIYYDEPDKYPQYKGLSYRDLTKKLKKDFDSGKLKRTQFKDQILDYFNDEEEDDEVDRASKLFGVNLR